MIVKVGGKRYENLFELLYLDDFHRFSITKLLAEPDFAFMEALDCVFFRKSST